MYTTKCIYTHSNSEKIVAHRISAKVLAQEPDVTFWLQQIAQGDSNAFWQLWMHYQSYLYHQCLRWMGNNRMDAEDVLSRAMFTARSKLEKYASTIVNIKSWLVRLTYNTCMDIWRERKRELGTDVVEQLVGNEAALIQNNSRPEEYLLREELEAVLCELIDQLPLRLYQPFMLKFCDHLSYIEISDHLSITYATARKRIQQAREILRQQITKYFNGEQIELHLETTLLPSMH